MGFATITNVPEGQPGQRAFPYKLYALLEEAELHGFAHIISWQPGGTSFRVHQPDLFTKSILPQCFKQSRYKSFLRQLNIYDFHRIQHGENKDGYCHRFLIRGKPDLCDLVVRVFVPSKKKKKQHRAMAIKPSLPCKGQDSTFTPQHDLGQLLAANYQDFGRTECLHPTVKASLNILSPDSETCQNNLQAWSSFFEGDDTAYAILTDLVDDDEVLNRDNGNGFQATTDTNVDPRGPQASFNTLNHDSFPGPQIHGTNFPVRSMVRIGSEQSLASCGSTASSVLASLPLPQEGSNLIGNTHNPNAIPQNIHETCSNVFGSLSLVKQVPWIRGNEDTSGMLKLNPNLVPSEFTSPLHLPVPSLASSCASSKSSCFPPIQQAVPNNEGAWFASTKEPLQDWPEVTSAGDGLSESERTDSSGLVIKNEDLTRSEAVFPAKLHRMLQDADREGFHHIVSWIQGGTAFQVHDVEAFMRHVMIKYFDQSKFQSFRRQLNLYQFTRVNSGVHGTYYFHKCFLQGDPSLCHQITRPKASRRSKRN